MSRTQFLTHHTLWLIIPPFHPIRPNSTKLDFNKHSIDKIRTLLLYHSKAWIIAILGWPLNAHLIAIQLMFVHSGKSVHSNYRKQITTLNTTKSSSQHNRPPLTFSSLISPLLALRRMNIRKSTDQTRPTTSISFFTLLAFQCILRNLAHGR